MSAKLEWDGDVLDSSTQVRIGMVRTRCAGIEYDFVTMVGGKREVSEPYQSKEDARQDCERAVRQALKAAGVEVSP